MKKFAILTALLLVLIVSISSHSTESEICKNKTKNIIIDDELVLEDWMTIPFNITDTIIKTDNHV